MIVLAPRACPPRPIDASSWNLDLFSSLTLEQIHQHPVFLGSHESTLGEWFRVSGTSDDSRMVVEGDCRHLHGLATHHRRGEFIIDGDAGDLVARHLRGGTVDVRGSVGNLAGSGMRAGILRIAGNAGDRLAGPIPGERTGMRGGTLIVGGNAGQQAGHRLRRGLIVVHGQTGEGAGFEMVAGTLVARQVSEVNLGFAMRRGTILALTPPDPQSPHFQARTFGAPYPAPLGFLTLLTASILEHAPLIGSAIQRESRQWQRSLGDLSVRGLGEILYPAGG